MTTVTAGSEFLVREHVNEGDIRSNQSAPFVMALSDGDLVVTWWVSDYDAGNGIAARIFDAQGQEVVGEFLVSEYTDWHQFGSSVTALSDGGFVVTWWQGHDYLDFDGTAISARIFDAQGQEVTDIFLVNEYTNSNQFGSSVTALSDGGFVVTWWSYDGQQGDASGSAVKARIFNAQGQEVVGEFLVNEYTNSDQSESSVTALPNGGFVVTWVSKDGQQGDASGSAIKARIFDAQGQEVVGEFLVNEYTNSDQSGSSVTALADGGFVVIWVSNDGQHGDASGSAVKARIFDAQGQEVVGEFLVNEYTNSDQSESSVTALPNGGFVVTWVSKDGQQGDASGSAVKARIFDAQGQEVVGELLVNEYTDGNQYDPNVTSMADGGFVVTWVSIDGQQGDASGHGIKARMFTFENQAPIARTDLAQVFEDQTVTGDVLLNDTDPDPADTLTVAAVNGEAGGVGQTIQGTWGTLVLHSDGSYSYAADADLLDTLAAGEVRKDSFDYTVSDGEDTETATLTVTVTAINDAETIHLGNKGDTYAAGSVWVDLDGDGSPDVQGDGDQAIHGGNGKDRIEAGPGADKLYGDNGNDWLDGGGGMDTLCGGRGDDTLVGGDGADTLVFQKAGGTDAVLGFKAGADMILLDGIALRQAIARDLDGNGTTDTLLRFSNGAAEILDVDLTGLIASDPDSVFII